MMSDPFNLQRFVEAQSPVFEEVCAELQAGRKVGHWMWFIFPQLKGLGSSAMADYYGIASKAEAEAYFRHPILGPRLVECIRLANLSGRSSQQIFGSVDTLKFRSCLTLFWKVAPHENAFKDALDRYFGS